MLFLIFPVISVFAQNAADYNKLLKGDFSAFTGYWVNGRNDRVYLRPDGTTYYRGVEANTPKKNGNFYIWNNYDEEYGIAVILYPVGVDVYGKDSSGKEAVIKTDKTKVRLFVGEEPTDSNDIYYKESVFPATHVTTENLKIRTDQNLNAETVVIIKKDAKVRVKEWGNNVTIDGKTARWARVYTSDGFEGWCYSGYLKELNTR